MNRRSAITVSALAALLLGSLVFALEYRRLKRVENRGPAYENVTAELPGDINRVAATIGETFNQWANFDRPDRIGKYQNKFPYGSHWSYFFLFAKDDAHHSSFPSDQEILLDRGVDSFVERYVRIPPELRNRDLYLYEPTGDYYWESEYFYQGKAAKFRCSFLIHLEPATNSWYQSRDFRISADRLGRRIFRTVGACHFAGQASRHSPRAADYHGPPRSVAIDPVVRRFARRQARLFNLVRPPKARKSLARWLIA